MTALHVHLFGRFRANVESGNSVTFEGRKAQELFCYLLLFHRRPHARESLAAVLWDENSTAQSKQYLRKALWQLQTALDTHLALDERIIRVDADWIQLDISNALWLDVAVFERVFAAVQGVLGHTLDRETCAVLQDTVDLYAGDLLEGWYPDWSLFERVRFEQMYLAMLDKIIDYCETHAEYEQGMAYGSRVLCIEPAHERTHRRLMRLYYMAGDRTSALRQYHRCLIALDEELHVDPSARTVALYNQIRYDTLAATAADAAAPNEALGRLKYLQRTLTELQSTIAQTIDALDHLPDG